MIEMAHASQEERSWRPYDDARLEVIATAECLLLDVLAMELRSRAMALLARLLR